MPVGVYVALDTFSYRPGSTIGVTFQIYDLFSNNGIPGVNVDVYVDTAKVKSAQSGSVGFGVAFVTAPYTLGQHSITVQVQSDPTSKGTQTFSVEGTPVAPQVNPLLIVGGIAVVGIIVIIVATR